MKGPIVSSAMLQGAQAAANDSRERTASEKAFAEIVSSVIVKGPHEEVEPRTDKLFVVTTLAASPRFGGYRTVVVCRTFARAREIVETNEGDIYEYSYQLVVIEGTLADCLYGGCCDEQYWYVWREGRYVPIERPGAFAQVIGFGVG